MGRQKRSENTYTKINTVFKRDTNGIIMPYDSYVMPELEWMKDLKFDAEEKIDGTNIRIEVTRDVFYYQDRDEWGDTELTDIPYKIVWHVAYKGKTDNANIPKMLEEYLKTTYPEEKVLEALGLKKEMHAQDEFTKSKEWVDNSYLGESLNMSKIPSRYTLYGEGYGVKIQSCGANYLSKTNSFVGFDVKVDNMYLLRPNRDEIFAKLGCPVAPFVGQFTILEAIEYVKNGFKSVIAENPEFMAEGLVLRSPYGILTRRGDRIIFKLKTCDWTKYYNQYGTYDPVEQIVNPHIQ